MGQSLIFSMLVVSSLPQLSEFESSGFTVYPTSQEICQSIKEATFRSSHQSRQADINWIVNETQVENFPEFKRNSHNDSAGTVYTLTMPVLLKYNGTVVKCVAFIEGRPPEITPPVTLIIIPDVVSNFTSSDVDSACYSDEIIETTAPSIGMHTAITTEYELYTTSSPKWTVGNVIALVLPLVSIVILLTVVLTLVLARIYIISWKKSSRSQVAGIDSSPGVPLKQGALKKMEEGSIIDQSEVHAPTVEDSVITSQSEASLMADSLPIQNGVSPRAKGPRGIDDSGIGESPAAICITESQSTTVLNQKASTPNPDVNHEPKTHSTPPLSGIRRTNGRENKGFISKPKDLFGKGGDSTSTTKINSPQGTKNRQGPHSGFTEETK